MLNPWRSPILKALVGAAALLSLPWPARAGGLPDTHYFASTEGAAAVREAMAAEGATSVCLALVNGQKFVWEEAFGFANADGEGPKAKLLAATSETQFGVGQVSRILATLAVMKLAEEGKVSLDDPVVKYLPEFRMAAIEYRQISIRMLLCQASGLPSDSRNRYTTVPFPSYAEQVMGGLALQRLSHPPGALGVPCSAGFTLVASLVKAVTGKPYDEYVRHKILGPLGMTRCGFAPEPGLLRDPYARVYEGMSRLPLEYANDHAGDGFHASATDMGRFMEMLLDGGSRKNDCIVSQASIQEMGRPQLPPASDPLPSPLTAFGLGWDTALQPAMRAAGFRAWAISGQTPHYGSTMILVPSERLGIFVAGARLSAEAATRIAERILMRALVEKRCLPAMPTPPEPPPLREAAGVRRGWEEYQGIYGSRVAAFRVRPGRFLGTLDLDRYQTGTATWERVAADLKLQDDGWFVSDDASGASGTAYRFHSWEDRWYLAKRWPSRFSLDTLLLAEKVSPDKKPDPRWAALRGGVWVFVNEALDSELFATVPSLTLTSLPDQDGTLFVQSSGFYPLDFSSKVGPGAAMLRIPGSCGQELNELWPVPAMDGLWLRCASRLYRPLASVPALCNGNNSIAAEDGQVQWRVVPASRSSITVNGFITWAILDSRFNLIMKRQGPGIARLAQGTGICFLAVQATPGTVGSVNCL